MIVQTLIGPSAEPAHLTALQVCVRDFLVFGCAMATVRLTTRRFLNDAGRASLRYRRLVDFLLGRPATPDPDGERGAEAHRRPYDAEPALRQGLRPEGGLGDLKEARLVTLERSGHISVVPRRPA